MNECATCKKAFTGEPFQFHLDESVFCSIRCYPEGTLDEPYAFTYAEMMELYRESVRDAEYMESISERDELADEVDLCMRQCMGEALLDPDAFYYNEEIAKLHDLFSRLYDEVYGYFMDSERYLYFDGLYLNWDELKVASAVQLVQRLKEVLEENERTPVILYGWELDAAKEHGVILFFPEAEQDENEELKMLYNEGVAFLEKELPKDTKVLIENAVSYIKLCECLICGSPEPYEDFGFNENYNVFACNFCMNLVRVS